MNNAHFPYPKFPWARSFVTRVICVFFHPSRNFPDTRKRYSVFIGRSFWRLMMFVYASAARGDFETSMKERLNSLNEEDENGTGPKTPTTSPSATGTDAFTEEEGQEYAIDESTPQNALITGIRGCGKSHLLMTAATFLAARTVSDLYRIVCIGDCRIWAASENPVAFFCLELMMAFRTALERAGKPFNSETLSAAGTLADGNYCPPGVFTSFEALGSWMEAVGKRIAQHDDLRLVIFVDQMEELYREDVSKRSPSHVMAVKIFELLLALKYPIIICSLIPSPAVWARLPRDLRDSKRFAEMRMPAVLTYPDFDMFSEVFEASRRLSHDDDPLMHDLRMWTGGVPAQVAKFFTFIPLSTTKNVAERLVKYRAERSRAFSELVVTAMGKMERLPRMHFLLHVLRMILHVPSDDVQLSAGAMNAAIGLESLFLPAAIQKFYHPHSGIISYRHIATAVSPAAHFALCDGKLLSKIAGKWEQVLQALLQNIIGSSNVCSESKRRVIRFYAQFKLFNVSFDEELDGKSLAINGDSGVASIHPISISVPELHFLFNGVSQFGDQVTCKLSTSIPIRRVIFAGLSPTPILIPSGRSNSTTSHLPIYFLPGRTDFCFYDFFLLIPAERTFYAFTTCPFASMLGASNGNAPSSGSTAITVNTATNSPLTPFTILDMWQKDLKDAGYSKLSIKALYISPMELIRQIDSK